MRVLFIGNSHTFFNDMPHTFSVLCRDLTGETPEVTMIAYSGRPLSWHLDDPVALRFALRYGRYDFCVIQQQAHPFPDEAVTEKDEDALLSLCRRFGSKPVLYMTWAEKAKPENAAVMSGFYRRLAARTGAMLCPVGELFEKIKAGHPGIDLYASDGAHASPAGDYLIAAAFASLLTGERDLSPLSDRCLDFHLPEEEAPRDADGMNAVLPAETARILRETAASIRE